MNSRVLGCLLASAWLGGTGCVLSADEPTALGSAESVGQDPEDGSDPDDSAPVGLQIVLSTGALSSAETLGVTVLVERASGALEDVSSEASLESQDLELLAFYSAGVGQPLAPGVVGVRASWQGLMAEAELSIWLEPAGPGDLAFNEVLSDGGVDADPNGDGAFDSMEDEFVEIVNAADITLDLSGVTLIEEDWPFIPRHVFPEGTMLQAGAAIVLFGGGNPSFLEAPHVDFDVVTPDDPGVAYGLALDDQVDSVVLLAADGETVAEATWGVVGNDEIAESPQDESLVLSPEIYGSDYIPHSEASSASGGISPGRLVDGSAFPGPDGIYLP